MRQLILLTLLVTLFITLLTGCASTQPGTANSPLPDTNRSAATEATAQSPLSPPAASKEEAAPAQTPIASTPAESQPRFFLQAAPEQPEAVPTQVMLDVAPTPTRTAVIVQNPIALSLSSLLRSLELPALLSQELASTLAQVSTVPWETALHRRFLPLIVNQPIDRVAEAKKLFNCSWVHRLTPSECEILVLFYLDTNGPRWREQRNWLRDPDPCKWGGMQCYDGQVRVLQVENNRLTGILTPEIGNLPITFLLLANNALHGSVPDSIAKMKQLESIDLSQNQLTGALHPNVAKFPNLRNFYFDRDKLWFDPHLFTCDGVNTMLTSECEALVSIYLAMNGREWKIKTVFSNTPPQQGNIFADEWLVGRDPCRWRGINCVEKHLDILDLHDSNLWGRVSPDFGKLTNLGQLNLSRNHLYGPLPLEFKNLTNLRFLRLGGNVRPPAVADDPTAHLCIPSEVFLRLEQTLSAEDMPPGGFCPRSD